MIDQLSLVAVYPEIFLLVMTCVISLVDLTVKSPTRRPTYLLTLLTLACVAFLQGKNALAGHSISGFGGMIVSDPMGLWLKCFAAIAMFVTLVYGRDYASSRDMLRAGDLFTLSLYALLGMFVMISGHNFLVIYLGLELLTLSSYALVALRRDDVQATEAAMKYFVLGALASGFLLYGMSMVYGATGSLDLAEVLKAIAGGEATLKGSAQVLVLGLVFVVAGLAFKLGVVPFHMWVPDVYHGAPTAITLMIGGAPKLAAFAIVIRLLVEGLRESKLAPIQYPDANSTLRLSYGKVRALPADKRNDAKINNYTTMEGMLKKYKAGDAEFDLPARLMELAKNKDFGVYADKAGHMPINFLTDNDITGGNSGSPVLNGKGELIGLAFDGNIEAMAGDVIFDKKLQRTINVDIRYVLWVVDKFSGATHIINEMDIVK